LTCVQSHSLPRYLHSLRQRWRTLLHNRRIPHLLACGLMAGCPLGSQASTAIINFEGELVNASCRVEAVGEASGEGLHMAIDFGTVAFADLRPPATWVPGHGKNFILRITCPGAMPGITRAKVTLEAASGSGLDLDEPSLLALSADSQARGAGIGLWSPADAIALDLSTRPVLSGLFSRIGDESIAKIVLAALYSRTSALAVGGSANAALPVTLSYE
jgi:major type 1 subunit fimbrin (pilin)